MAPQTDAAAPAAAARAALDELLAAAPEIADRLPPGYPDAAQRYVGGAAGREPGPEPDPRRRARGGGAAAPARRAGRAAPARTTGGHATPWISAPAAGCRASPGLARRRCVDARRLRSQEGGGAAVLWSRRWGWRRSRSWPSERRRWAATRPPGALRPRCGASLCATPRAAGARAAAAAPGWRAPRLEGAARRGRGGCAAAGWRQPSSAEVPCLRPSGIGALGGHTFVVVTKERATPARFPRRPGEPGRRPLA